MLSIALAHQENAVDQSSHFFDMFRFRSLRRNTVIMCFCWFAFCCGYYGLVYNTPAFEWNLFLVFVFPTFINIPLSILQPLMENKLGRKAILTFSLLGAGVLLLLTTAFPSGSLVRL